MATICEERSRPRTLYGSYAPCYRTKPEPPSQPQPAPPPIPVDTHPCSPFGQAWTTPPSMNNSSPAVHNKDGFHINLDVQQFKQDAVIVKTVGYYVIIEAKHEEKQDDNRVLTRQMTRKYELPDDVDVDKIICKLSSDGMLHVKIPKRAPPPPPDSVEKLIPIIYTHTPASAEK